MPFVVIRNRALNTSKQERSVTEFDCRQVAAGVRRHEERNRTDETVTARDKAAGDSEARYHPHP